MQFIPLHMSKSLAHGLLLHILLTCLWSIHYTMSNGCDPISNYLCAQAVFSGNYDNCAGVIANYPGTWGVCEIKDCMDLDSVNNYTGMSEIQRQQVADCLFIPIISGYFPTIQSMKCKIS